MTLAVDTSAAVALIMASHVAHRAVRRHLRGRDLVLTQHSLAETYSVLTAWAFAFIPAVFGLNSSGVLKR